MKLYCYHMGCQATITQLATNAGVYIDPEKRLQIVQYVSENARIKPKVDYLQKLSYSVKIDELENYFNEGGIGRIIGFRPVTKGSKVHEYLVHTRMLPEKKVMSEMYEGGLQITDRWIEPVAAFINFAGDNVMGLQTRSARTGSKHFKMHTFSELYNSLSGNEMDEVDAAHYNKIGSIFNIFNVNLESTVYGFESYTDSAFFPNSIAGVGVNTDFTPIIDACTDLKFVFDNDKAGYDAAARYSKTHSVFLWKRLFDDLSKRMNDPIAYMRELMKIKDMNKLATTAKMRTPYRELELYKYFSEDEFDKLWIPKIKRKKAERTQQGWDALKKDVLAWS